MKLNGGRCVGCGVDPTRKTTSVWWRAVRWAVLATVAGGGARAAEGVAPVSDVLVYADGDRVRGRLVERAGDMLVFQSEKFGRLTVPATAAHVETAAPAVAAPAPPAAIARAPKHPEPEEPEPVGWARFAPWVLTQQVRNFFGPWHGRFAVSSEVVADTTDRNTTLLEARIGRKWSHDEVELTGRYDFARTAAVTTKDLIKLGGSWRRDFPQKVFSIYRPTAEYNRAVKLVGVGPADYFLIQQEIGAGMNLFTSQQRKLRAGISENLFDVWVTVPTTRHTSRTSESAFAEVEWTLPWRLHLTERGVWYPPLRRQADGWENRVELNKKLTETLSVAVRHETRRNNPDPRIQDYTLLRLLVGLDF